MADQLYRLVIDRTGRRTGTVLSQPKTRDDALAGFDIAIDVFADDIAAGDIRISVLADTEFQRRTTS